MLFRSPEWKRFIIQILQAKGYWTHVEGTDGAYDIFPKSVELAACTATSKLEEMTTFKDWWQEDMKAQAIILCRISPITHSHLNTQVGRTACSIWEHLHTLYAHTDILAQFELWDCLSNVKLWDHRDLHCYLGEFKDACECFLAMNVTYTKFKMVHHIIRGIPDGGAWGHFHQLMTQTMQDHVKRENHAAAGAKSDPDTLLDQITTRLMIKCQHLDFESHLQPHASATRLGPGSEYTNFSQDDGTIRKHAHNPNEVECSNCHQHSHNQDHCYREGGGMAGQGPHTKTTVARSKKSSASKQDVAALMDVEAFEGDLSCASIDNVPEELTELAVNSWSMLLDSGATSHLVKSQEYFWTYNEEAAWNVKTANLGILQTQASGTCIVVFSYNRIFTKVTLRDCLHAPHAFVNLLSVGQFVTGENLLHI